MPGAEPRRPAGGARTHYDLLGVAADASLEAITHAYRKAAMAWHPDRNRARGAHERFVALQAAFEELRDPERRAAYDRRMGFDARRVEVSSPGFDRPGSRPAGRPGGPGNAFAQAYEDRDGAAAGNVGAGGPSDGAAGFGLDGDLDQTAEDEGLDGSELRGRDLVRHVRITLAEQIRGAERDVMVTRSRPCNKCGGHGRFDAVAAPCPKCDGKGQLPYPRTTFLYDCPLCSGSGRVSFTMCASCRGTGRQPTRRSVAIRIPPGTRPGEELRLPGMGSTGLRRGPPGDLAINVGLADDPLFECQTFPDLVLPVYVSQLTALAGGPVTIPTVLGTRSVELPALVADRTIVRVDGEGLAADASGRRGALLVVVKVVPVERCTPEMAELLRVAERRRAEGDADSDVAVWAGKVRDYLRRREDG